MLIPALDLFLKQCLLGQQCLDQTLDQFLLLSHQVQLMLVLALGLDLKRCPQGQRCLDRIRGLSLWQNHLGQH